MMNGTSRRANSQARLIPCCNLEVWIIVLLIEIEKWSTTRNNPPRYQGQVHLHVLKRTSIIESIFHIKSASFFSNSTRKQILSSFGRIRKESIKWWELMNRIITTNHPCIDLVAMGSSQQKVWQYILSSNCTYSLPYLYFD